ncbi:phenylacetate-CoA oxygenase subunit PaaC [Nakamurella sp. DB0629]|uniref:Phenylacetate-CoA oxygenase subunit PaaC n=2 Tax=Nakamurella aerolata TaxID=1656892 RepID=A0A849AJV2_9ACTN|nr:phenylacetate-CoA oxygenase subunit PaaC [Nakamurella aerolata]
MADMAEYLLWLGDDALVSAQRLGEWITNAPELEEDVALGNIGLDQLGQARALLSYAGELLGRNEDELAYFRDDVDFRCTHLVSLPRGDFADAVVRLLLVGAYSEQLYAALTTSADERLAGIAAKAIKEVRYHVEHAAGWAVRLGDGTDESHRRMQDALNRAWPYLDELFDPHPLTDHLDGIAVDPATLKEPALQRITAVLDEATLTVPATQRVAGGGRDGRPSEHLGPMLAVMQVLARAHPGASW